MKSLIHADDQAEVLERLRRLRPDTKAVWGRMNAHQMVCHLSDSLRLAMGERIAASDTNPLKQSLWKWVALYLPVPWPKGVATRPELDPLQGGTPPTDFDVDCRVLRSLMERFTETPPRFSFGYHPIFGNLTRQEWMRWGYLHCDHHLRQFGV